MLGWLSVGPAGTAAEVCGLGDGEIQSDLHLMRKQVISGGETGSLAGLVHPLLQIRCDSCCSSLREALEVVRVAKSECILKMESLKFLSTRCGCRESASSRCWHKASSVFGQNYRDRKFRGEV